MKVQPLQRCVTSVCSVANGLKGIIQWLEGSERSRKRGFFFVCVPAVLESIQGGYKEQREHHPIKGKQG